MLLHVRMLTIGLCTLAFTLTSAPLRADWIFSAYAGLHHARPGWMTIDVPSEQTRLRLEPVEWEGRSFSRPLYYGVRAGWFPLSNGSLRIGPEIEFIHAKVYLHTDRQVQAEGVYRGEETAGLATVDTLIQDFNISHGLNLILANLALRRSLAVGPEHPEGRLVLTGRFGYGFNYSHFESIVLENPYFERYAFGGACLQLSGGLEVPLWGGLKAMTEYKFTRSRPQGTISGGGTGRTQLRSHHLVFGLSFRR